MILGRQQLDAMISPAPRPGHAWFLFHPSCHPAANTRTSYDFQGHIIIECNQCGQEIASIQLDHETHQT